MKIISLIIFLVALSTNPAISKIYEYKKYLEDNNIQPLVKSSEENSVDIIEFSSFSCNALIYNVCNIGNLGVSIYA